MRGSAMAAAQYGLETLLSVVRQDSRLTESVHLSLSTFSHAVVEVFPLTPAAAVEIPDMSPPRSGPSLLGAALASLMAQIKAERQPEDLPPVVLVLGDGAVGDLLAFRHQAERLKSLPCSEIMYCNSGVLPFSSPVRLLSDRLLQLDTADAASFLPLFRAVLPPPPAPAPTPDEEPYELPSDLAEDQPSEPSSDNDMPGGSLPPPPPDIQILL
jgi:uncharacterized protein YegL